MISTAPPKIKSGAFHSYFIFDLADTIDLDKLQSIAGVGVERAQLQLRSVASPSYIKFTAPPLVASLPDVVVRDLKAQARIKLYDYGVAAIRLSFPLGGTWEESSNTTRQLRESDLLLSAAQKLLADVMPELRKALKAEHDPMMEDYFIFEVNSFENSIDSVGLMKSCRSQLTGLLLGESRLLTVAEQDEALKVNFSYFDDDLTVIQWESAFVLEKKEGWEAIESILEFANSQLVELRRYDARLDSELDTIYSMEQEVPPSQRLFSRRIADQRATRLRHLLVDVRELVDRSSNALKFIGDAYYARLYRGAASRLSLSDWQHQLDSKLGSIGDFYKYLTDQAQNARAEFMEVVVIVLIAVEVVIGLLGLHH